MSAPRIACFFATSGHSGVDRLVRNLLPGLAAAGYQVDLLTIRDHGPHLDEPGDVRCIELPARHARLTKTEVELPALGHKGSFFNLPGQGTNTG